MLKINLRDTPAEERWILHGRLTAPWVRELRASWRKNHRTEQVRPCIIDLNEVTFIDKSGQRLLHVLVSGAAECLASGVYIKHVLEQLTSKGKSRTFDRLLRRFRGSCWGHWAPR